MRNLITFSFVLTLVSAGALPASAGIVLSADFEGKTVDQPIGEGGPAVGEPVFQSSAGMVRNAPFPSNCLEFKDDRDFGTAGARFEFLEDVEITTGILTISADLWFSELNGYYYYTRENGTAAKSFNTVYFTSGGTVISNDATGSLGTIGQYTPGRSYALRIEHDLDTGLYDLWWDGNLVVSDRAHGNTGRGIGTLWFGFDHDSDLLGSVYVDNILVEATSQVTNQEASWGQVKTRFE